MERLQIYGAPLDPNDPEDILTIIAFALGGAVADLAGTLGMKVEGTIAGRVAKDVFQKEGFAALKRLGAKAGLHILQKSVVKYTVPVVSMLIGGGWNYTATRTMARVACRHFATRCTEAGGQLKRRTALSLSRKMARSPRHARPRRQSASHMPARPRSGDASATPTSGNADR